MNNTRTGKTWPVAASDRRCARQGIVLGILAGSVLFACSIASAQDLQIFEPTEPSAPSTLDSTSVNGRIGGYQYDGSLKPTPGKSSRFSNNAKYGSAGNIVGVDPGSSMSRFQSGSSAQFQSKMDFDILSLRNEIQRARAKQGAGNGARSDKFDSGAPRLVTAHEPSRFPYAQNRRPSYGRYPDELLAQQSQTNSPDASVPDATVPAASTPTQGMTPNIPQQLWMRGRAPQTGSAVYDLWRNQTTEADLYGDESYFDPYAFEPYADGYYNNGLGGALSLGNSSDYYGAISFPPPDPTPAQARQAFQEYLETQILRSPDVNPLSPVEVSYQDGVVTVRGVVPTPSARVKAGNILLADPRVSKVNNLMTYIRNDDVASVAPNAPSSSTTQQQNTPDNQSVSGAPK